MTDMEIYFLIGFATCMICDVVFSVVNMFFQRALYYKDLKKQSNDDE